MSDEQAAAAATDETAKIAPTESETATPTASVPDDAAKENAGTTQDQAEQEPAQEGGDTEPERKPLTRSQRLQRKNARLATIVAEQNAEIERLKASARESAGPEPKEADYNGDWVKFQADTAAWAARKAIKEELSDGAARVAKQNIAERERAAMEDFNERSERARAAIPDFDDAMEAFVSKGGRFNQHIIEEIRDSEKGPELAYHIVKTPGLAADLNALSERDAAREIGRIESKLALPQPRKSTQAPAPIAPLKGGGSSPAPELASLAKQDDATAYWEARRAQEKARA